MRTMFRFLCWLAVQTVVWAAADYSQLGARLEPVIREEMREWGLKGIAVALVDGPTIVYSAGFGEARRDSAFRVGSISKLFNAIAVMQQVEKGRLDLDAPLPREVLPENPFPGAPAVTLRQLLCHRSGLPRETPVGGYLDGSEPTLAATVDSLRECVLVTVPGAKMRYSNIGPSLAGAMVERVTGQDFEAYQRAHILDPLGATHAAWRLKNLPPGRLVPSHLRLADGRGGWRHLATPVFDLGTIPAGNLFASAEDLARFASALLAGGAPLVSPATLDEMWKPQFTTDKSGFGLGFMIGNFRAHRTVSHSGAVYGHSTSFVVLPEAKLAAIVLINEDIANGRVRRISQEALFLLVQAKLGENPPAAPEPFVPADLAPFAGDFESQSYWARVEVKDGRLIGDISGQPTRFTPLAELQFAAHSRIEDAARTTFIRAEDGAISGFTLGGQKFERVRNPAPLPAAWRKFLGSYGPSFIPIIVSERHGHLYAMTENMVDYRLTPINRHVFGLPPGMYIDEQVVFLSDARGRVHGMEFASMPFPRHR